MQPQQPQPVMQPQTPQQPLGSVQQPVTTPPKKDKKQALSTQNSLLFSEMRENMIIMNDGSFRAIVRCQSINFDLMSSREREAIEYSYQNFLNSLYFPVQILIRSQRVDIGPYLDRLVQIRRQQDNMLLNVLMDNYIQFIVLKELTGAKSYTIVGDSNQRLIDTKEVPAMLKLNEILDNVMEFSLNKSYRSTQQIMEYASKFLDEEKIIPLVRSGEAVLEEETESLGETIDTITSIIEDYEDEGLESIAVITKKKDELKDLSHNLKEKVKILTFDRNDIIYRGGKVLVPAYFAKGLEFDGVIILEDDTDTPNLVKYIMCTRALHRLSVIKQIKK